MTHTLIHFKSHFGDSFRLFYSTEWDLLKKALLTIKDEKHEYYFDNYNYLIKTVEEYLSFITEKSISEKEASVIVNCFPGIFLGIGKFPYLDLFIEDTRNKEIDAYWFYINGESDN